MKSRIAGVISGTAIVMGVTVAAFSIVGTANAKSTTVVPSQMQMMVGRSEHGRPDLSKVAAVLGLSTDELKAQLQSGKSLAEIAKAQSVNISKVIDTIVADIKTKLAAEVASGEHTQAEVDAKLTEITARVTEMVNNTGPKPGVGFGGREGHGPHRAGRPDLSKVAAVLGLSTDELKAQLQSGKSLAEIAKAQSVNISKVIDTIVADIKTKLAAEVASGEHTQAEVDAKLTEITARVTEMVNNTGPKPGVGFGGREGHGPRGHGQGSNA